MQKNTYIERREKWKEGKKIKLGRKKINKKLKYKKGEE